MGSQRILGVVLLVVGVVLLVMGVNASHSVADQFTHAFTGHFTDATTWYILGGIASAVVGLLMLAVGIRGKGV
jgi:uncharacterized membrane protein YidH (DUF202 family)